MLVSSTTGIDLMISTRGNSALSARVSAAARGGGRKARQGGLVVGYSGRGSPDPPATPPRPGGERKAAPLFPRRYGRKDLCGPFGRKLAREGALSDEYADVVDPEPHQR